MCDFLISYQFLSVLGLLMDIIGVIMMFYNPGEMRVSGFAPVTSKQEWGLVLLIMGFGLQLFSSFWSYFA
ncbi:hypothetical protein [Flavivirga jejuensis]|uniref:Uncharacterized protein n=1 Tax=Flavivirga jejuensis TaxID=870487 RepID=A0ABT8WK89_9FLAO|nr:hypothetical protein [Flavivirga jejuensis]MDO5973537.1 hypothetical protein [Flavivirga jejuensis]